MKTTATHSDPSLRLMHFTKIALLAAVVVGGIGEASPALANGGKSMNVVLGASESDGITFETAVEWATFLLNTAGDKYMLIRLTVKNNSARPLLLSSTYDAIEVYFGNKKVKGILDLSRQDPALWQALARPSPKRVIGDSVVNW